jgi:hypothetical protein
MFDIEICEAPRIALIRFRGQVTEQDFAALDALARQRQGRDAYDTVFDLTEVEKSDVTTDFVAKRGGLPQVFTNRQRIYVVPQDDLKLLVRLYAAYQEAKGWRPPTVVDSLDEALESLQVTMADFRPVTLSPAGS